VPATHWSSKRAARQLSTTVQSGGTEIVSSGGVASATTVQSGALVSVGSGGDDVSTTILSGGTETVLIGGSASGDQISGTLNVISTVAAVSNETVYSGGLLNISKSATVGNTTLISGGTVDLLTPAATLSGTLTFSGGDNTLLVTSVANGGAGDQAVISGFSSSDTIDVRAISPSSASLAFTTSVISGGTDTVATISGTGGSESFIFSGTTTYNQFSLSLVSDGHGGIDLVYNPNAATITISSGTTSSGLTAGSGNTIIVESGGSVISTTVQSGGAIVVSGGADTSATILSGGTETVSSGGSATGDQIYGGATAGANATVTSETVESGGKLVVSSGAVDSGSTVLAGGSQTVFGSATGDQIAGSTTVAAGATVTSETVLSGGTLAVSSGGTADPTTIYSGGSELVSAGGTDDGALISGGTQLVYGYASGATAFSGGSQLVEFGGAASGTTVLTGATLALDGSVSATNTVLSGGTAAFSGGDNTLAVTVVARSTSGDDQATISGLSFTDQIVVSGVGSGATLSFSTSGGNEVVTVSGASGAETFIFSGTSTYTSNTLSLVSSGGAVDLEYSSTTSVTTSTASGAYTEGFHNTLLVLDGGSVSAATINSGGSLTVSSGGDDFAAIVLAGGTETVSSGGSATGDQIGGTATVDAGATVTSDTVRGGGTLVVSTGAFDSASTVIAGGTETVLGSATGDQIYGTQLVSGEAAAVGNETVQDRGMLVIGAAATASNTVLNGGGTVELEAPTATLSGSLMFMDGGNTLVVASLASGGDGDQAVISGFSAADQIVISGVGSGAALSFSTSGGNEIVTVSGGSGAETFIFAGTSTYTSNTLSLGSSGGAVDLETSVPLSDFNIQAYNPAEAGTISAGPLALYSVAVDSIAPTQMNEGFTEVDIKAAGFDLDTSLALVEADLVNEIEPVVIGPGGQLYLLDGHHTFTSLLDSVWGAGNPTVYVNVIANYSTLTEQQFITQMQANNWLLPLNDGVPQSVSPSSGSISPPIPTTLTGLTSDVYRGLEYSILKQKDSKLFTTSSNITGATGASTPDLDKMTGIYSDFLEAAAYRAADAGLGLPYLSPGDIALATDWNLNPASTTTLPNVSGTVVAAQLPGFILNQNLVEGSGSAANTVYFAPGGISNATLAGNGSLDGSGEPTNGALAGDGTFTAITEINAGTVSNPIWIGSPNVGFIMQLGNDNKFTVTLTGTNTYTGGTSIHAGRLIIAGDSSLGEVPTESNSAFNSSLTFDPAGVPTNVQAAVQADNGIIFNSLTEGNGTLTIGTSTSGTFTTSRPIAIGSEAATIDVNDNTVTLNGPLITLGYDGVGLGVTNGFSPLTIDDLSANGGKTATAGTLVLATASPYFYGDIIVGNTGTPTVEVMNDAALGYNGNNAEEVGTVELNGGTLQTGASFSASERDINLEGGSQIDLDGNTTTWGTLTDVKRTLAIGNSSATPGAITFNNFTISQTAILQLDGAANGTTYTGSETVTFTNGINQTAAQDTLILGASSPTALGTVEKVFSNGASTQLVDGIAPVWIVTNEGNSSGNGPYDFVTYGANGYVQESGAATTLGPSTGSNVVTLGQCHGERERRRLRLEHQRIYDLARREHAVHRRRHRPRRSHSRQRQRDHRRDTGFRHQPRRHLAERNQSDDLLGNHR
jgi:autotransporter passenger strand-loop-strand repeat protein/autotransporter-associated beta strand protein